MLFCLFFVSFDVDYVCCKGHYCSDKKYEIEVESAADKKCRLYSLHSEYLCKRQQETALCNTCRTGERKHFHCHSYHYLNGQNVDISCFVHSVCPVDYPRNGKKADTLYSRHQEYVEHYRKILFDVICAHCIGITYPYELFGVFFLV